MRLHGKKLQNATNNLFKFSAQDSDLEYLCWRRKNFPVSSDLKLTLVLQCGTFSTFQIRRIHSKQISTY